MKIALYGGSFNPPHKGHVEAAKTAAKQLGADRFLIIPDRTPPHKELSENAPSPGQRLEMCKLAFGGIHGAEVSDMELKREGKSYTADTVSALRGEYPDAKLTLVVGTDMFLTFTQWYKAEFLLKECKIAVLSREEDDAEQIKAEAERLEDKYGAKIKILNHEAVVMSSSDIREKLRMRLGSDLLPDEVYSYIIKNNLYESQPELSWLREKAYSYLNPKRIAHVAGCEGEAVRLARYWGENEDFAAEAGILHDITKKLNAEEHIKLIKKYNYPCTQSLLDSPKLLHAVTGALLAKHEFGAPDEITNAIRWHTTGKPDMTMLEKIIYLADYVEPNRDFEGVNELRALCYKDIDKAMGLGLNMSLNDIRSRNLVPYVDTVEAAIYYNK